MSTKLLICLFILAILNAGASAFPISTTATPESFDNETALFINETLTKIYNACVSFKDRAEMTGNTLKAKKNLMVTDFLLEVVPEIIGLYELRSVLGFAPPVSWAQRKSATNEELEAAPTIEAYYNLKEPFVYEYNPKGNMLIEKYLPTAVALLNKRIPEIRNVYRKYFEDKLGSLQGKIDRAGVDYMIKQYDDINSRVGDVIWILPIYNRSDCFFMEAEENTRTESDRKRFWKLIESIAEN